MAQAINLQITPSNVMPKIYASQFDIGREIEISLYDGASAYVPPVGTDIRFEGKKPDGNGFSYACTYSDNVVTVVTTDQMTVLAGEIPCELRMSLNGDDIGTLNIIFVIEKSPIDENVPISDTEIPAIIGLARDEQYTAEAWAVGERNGVPVGPTDPQYHNNAKYWAEHAEYGALDDLTDVEITTPTNGQVVTYNGISQKWENKDIPSDTVTQAIIAPVEGATSLHAYAVGEQLIYNNTLYKVIAPISVNDALVVNTNIEVSPKTVIEQVEDNASEIDDVWATMTKNGAKNKARITATTQTVDGITYTIDQSAGTVIVSGSLAAGKTRSYLAIGKVSVVAGDILTGCPVNGGPSDYELIAFNSSQTARIATDIGNGAVATSTDANAVIGIYIHKDLSSPIQFDTMVRIAEDADRTFAPHAMTNRELTEYTKKSTSNISWDSTYIDGTERYTKLSIMGKIAVFVGGYVKVNTAIPNNTKFASLPVDVTDDLMELAFVGNQKAYMVGARTNHSANADLYSRESIPTGNYMLVGTLLIY